MNDYKAIVLGYSLLFLSACQLISDQSREDGLDKESNRSRPIVNTAKIDERAGFVASLFTGAEQYQNFNRLKDIFPSKTLAASSSPYQFEDGKSVELPKSYIYEKVQRKTADFLRDTDTAALLVIKDGKVVYENYDLTGGRDVQWTSMSVGKSFVSALVGIAINDGLISSVSNPITRYVPRLKGSAYDNVSIKDILQMSSGARWNEDYSDPDSDIMRYGKVWASGGSFDVFTASLVRERPPGTYNYYNSTDTQALGMLLVSVAGKSLTAYAEEKLWQPLGMEYTGYWIGDDQGMEMAAGGLQATARDYAKLGQLYMQQGQWQGKQLVPAAWVHDSLVADSPHVQAAAHPEYPVGYGYQWWLPVSDEGEFSAIGVYNQFIFVNPTRKIVIVKLSANSSYGLTNDESSHRELETIELFRTIIKQVSP